MPVLLQKAFWSFQLYCFNKRPFLLTVLLFTCVLRLSLLQKKKNTINFILTIVFPSHFYPGCSDRQYPFIAISTQYFLSCCRISFGKLPSIHTVFLQFYHYDPKDSSSVFGHPRNTVCDFTHKVKNYVIQNPLCLSYCSTPIHH